MPMKKLYHKRGKVHPSLSPPSIDDHLAQLLPSAILTLITTLSGEDKRVLAYLVSWSNNNNNSSSHQENGGFSAKNGRDGQGHAFNCDCFECYMSFWARWNSSPNRRLIHDVIEAYEEELAKKNKPKNGRMKRRKNNKSRISDDPNSGSAKEEKDVEESALVTGNTGGDEEKEEEEEEEEEDSEVGTEKGACRRLFNFIGEKISGFWTMG